MSESNKNQDNQAMIASPKVVLPPKIRRRLFATSPPPKTHKKKAHCTKAKKKHCNGPGKVVLQHKMTRPCKGSIIPIGTEATIPFPSLNDDLDDEDDSPMRWPRPRRGLTMLAQDSLFHHHVVPIHYHPSPKSSTELPLVLPSRRTESHNVAVSPLIPRFNAALDRIVGPDEASSAMHARCHG
mmetsp:Transcript_28837/g.69677  ORF Transcript_28837/g.69677 Transcript_28837/m.69677 type:complete len:183 (+) Transcript_28837:462-1010(+)|eukprot:CAMPEP_0113649606 /NCGR_PEP_ID=MMETSP0017_2-20120614/26366_1 /TAXON_ID=2856 /ORGANISM="Cylindrotheca closterium" /LENGTH=182 /DNA_ID=CAMNT_0000562005 /DNA_START=377 /DNA_END=922 /DNA_ORIENTATION=- /assembly_acc=CAM_ASM_000147